MEKKWDYNWLGFGEFVTQNSCVRLSVVTCVSSILSLTFYIQGWFKFSLLLFFPKVKIKISLLLFFQKNNLKNIFFCNVEIDSVVCL